MIYTDLRVPASGPRNATLAAIGMSPAKNEIADKVPFIGPSGRIFNDSFAASKFSREKVFVTNLCNFFIDDNDLYSVPPEVLENERARVFAELDEVRPNVLLVMGVQTLTLLQEGYVGPFKSATQKKAASKWAITKWRGSIIPLTTPSGRIQKCVVAHHPAGFVRGMWKWLPIFKYVDVPRAVTQSSSPLISLARREAIVGPSFQTACDFLREMDQATEVCFDYEGRSHLTCLGIGSSPNLALCIPLNRVGSSSYWTVEQECTIWKLWARVMQNARVRKFAQNAPFEWIKSWLYGFYPNPLGLDTMSGNHCLYPDFGGVTDEWTGKKRDPSNPGHGLAFLTSFYTDIPFYKDDGRHWTPALGERRFWEYNCMDVMSTFEVGQKEQAELRACGLWDFYQSNYLDTFEAALRMEWQGVAIDLARRDALRVEYNARIAATQAQLKQMTGLTMIPKGEKGKKTPLGELNLASPAQVLKYLKGKRYQVRLNKKTKRETVDKDTFQMLIAQHPNDRELPLMLALRKDQDFINDNLDTEVDEEGRMHSHVKQGGTNGTRWSTAKSILGSGRNFQNLDRQGPARSLFLPS